jgi:hypothetical protein
VGRLQRNLAGKRGGQRTAKGDLQGSFGSLHDLAVSAAPRIYSTRLRLHSLAELVDFSRKIADGAFKAILMKMHQAAASHGSGHFRRRDIAHVAVIRLGMHWPATKSKSSSQATLQRFLKQTA